MMTRASADAPRAARWIAGVLSMAIAGTFAISCASSKSMNEQVMLPPMAKTASTTDERVGLKAGLHDAGQVSMNMDLVGHAQKPSVFDGDGGTRGLTFANSDLAFKGTYVYQGNFSGFQIWDISNVASPKLVSTVTCSTGQGDPSVYGNLLFISSESTGDRTDCSNKGVSDRVSMERMIGVRIFDISDPTRPKKVADVQTCRGSHTHTLVPDPNDKGVVYVYVSGSGQVRPVEELAGCVDGPVDSVNSARFRIEIIRVPIAHPEQAKVVSFGRIFNGLEAPARHGETPTDAAAAAARQAAAVAAAAAAPAGANAAGGRGGRGGRGGAPGGPGGARGGGPNQCHDITVYPEAGLAGGACGGYGLLLDIKDPLNPKRLYAAGDSNFAFWHSATFNNDGTKVVFTDEWGGGTSPKCRADDPIDWGADAIFTIENGKLKQGAYFKMPAAQTSTENCVAHNGSLVPVPGRDIMVQGWYQGGVSVFDFSNADHPYEIAHYDRGPVDADKLVTAGSWGAYWYNGNIISSEIARGLDIMALKPSEFLTQNEIDAAKLVRWDEHNPQDQPKISWPAAFPVVRAYLDQLNRGHGLSKERMSAIANDVNSAEKIRGCGRKAPLNTLAAQLDSDAVTAADAARVRKMAAAVRDLANAPCLAS